MQMKDDSSRMLSAFSLTDMNRGENPRCDLCQTSDTPEWRKGPNGPRTLCNACGLRYSKQVRKTEKPKKEKSYEWFIYTTPDKVKKFEEEEELVNFSSSCSCIKKVVKVEINQQSQQQQQQAVNPSIAALAQRAATASPTMRQSPMTVGYEANDDTEMMDVEQQPQPPVHIAKPLAQQPPLTYQPPFLGVPMMPMAVNTYPPPMNNNLFGFGQLQNPQHGAKMNLDFILN